MDCDIYGTKCECCGDCNDLICDGAKCEYYDEILICNYTNCCKKEKI